MFTGIVEDLGAVARLLRRGGGARLEVRAPRLGPFAVGESIAVNGACVTVTESNGEAFACDLVPETVARTNLGILLAGDPVNLERPLRAGDRMGGHIVQGHVDAVGTVRSRRRVGAQEVMEITVPFELTRYLATQGSVALDGVSLTVVTVDRDRFRVALIPHTIATTTLGRKIQGAPVNVEVDVLSKYVERHMALRAPRPLSRFEEPREQAGAETPRSRPAPSTAAAAAPAAQQKTPPRAKPPARPKPPASAKPKPRPKPKARTAARRATARRPAKRAAKPKRATKRRR